MRRHDKTKGEASVTDKEKFSWVGGEQDSWKGTYSEDWRKHKIWTIIFWCIPASMCGLGFIISGLHYINGFIALSVFLLIPLWIIVGIYVNGWKCPRCNKCYIYPQKRFLSAEEKKIRRATIIFESFVSVVLFCFTHSLPVMGAGGGYTNPHECANCGLRKYPKIPTGNDPTRFDSI